MQQRKKPYYSLEFKQDAAQLVLSKGYTVAEAAKSLGASESAVRKWVNAEKGIDNNVLPFNSKLSLSDHEELLKLRKENIRLKMEREILKKDTAFFVQEQN